MSSVDTPESIQKEVRGYFLIFAGLISLSLTAVGLNYLKLPLTLTIILTLLIAAVQVYLAAGYFMHLLSEKAIVIYIVLATTISFFIAILALPFLEHSNPIMGTTHFQTKATSNQTHHTEPEHVP